ncbi:MAG: serine/threonine-protein kinase [Nannocystaceae bacterium]
MPTRGSSSSEQEDTQRTGSDPSDPMGQVPHELSRYKLLHELGSGGFGKVFAGFDPKLNRRVAIKLLHSRTSRFEDGSQIQEPLLPVARAQQRLLREAQNLALFTHPNVVKVFDVGTYQLHRTGRLTADEPTSGEAILGVFVVMEYVDGDTLDTWQAAKPRTWQEILETYIEAGEGLSAAHANGLVHRDFKPANVIVGSQGVRVLDFGLARAIERSAEPVAGASSSRNDSELVRLATLDTLPNESSLSGPGRIMGTPTYMAPEQLLGQLTGPYSDQFGFCVALFEALFQCLPFAGDNLSERASRVVRGEIRDMPKVSGVPAFIYTLLARGLTVDPSERFPSMRALLIELSGALSVADPEHLLTTKAFTELNTSQAERDLIRRCISTRQPQLIVYRELTYPTETSLEIMRASLSEQTASWPNYVMMVNLSGAAMPTMNVRTQLPRMFGDPHLKHVAVYIGGADPVVELAAKLVVEPMLGEHLTFHRDQDDAIARLRAELKLLQEATLPAG